MRITSTVFPFWTKFPEMVMYQSLRENKVHSFVCSYAHTIFVLERIFELDYKYEWINSLGETMACMGSNIGPLNFVSPKKLI